MPKGARIRGVVPAHANLFVAKWYRNARAYREDGTLYKGIETHELMRRTLHVPAVQFRLNDTDDDIEVLQPATELRQAGYETGPHRCSVGGTGRHQPRPGQSGAPHRHRRRVARHLPVRVVGARPLRRQPPGRRAPPLQTASAIATNGSRPDRCCSTPTSPPSRPVRSAGAAGS